MGGGGLAWCRTGVNLGLWTLPSTVEGAGSSWFWFHWGFNPSMGSGSCQALTHGHVDMGTQQGYLLAFSKHQHRWRR